MTEDAKFLMASVKASIKAEKVVDQVLDARCAVEKASCNDAKNLDEPVWAVTALSQTIEAGRSLAELSDLITEMISLMDWSPEGDKTEKEVAHERPQQDS